MSAHFIARDDLLTYRQVAEQYGIAERTLKHWAETGQIAYETARVGRQVRKFRRSVVMALMVKHEAKVGAAAPVASSRRPRRPA